MGVLKLPVQPLPSMSHHPPTLTLDKQRYAFRFYTNVVGDCWHFDIGDVLRGITIANGPDLLYPYRYLGDAIPPGMLYVHDIGLDGKDPDLRAFADGRALLVYEEALT